MDNWKEVTKQLIDEITKRLETCAEPWEMYEPIDKLTNYLSNIQEPDEDDNVS